MRITGPLVEIEGLDAVSMFETVAVGPRGEIGEIVRIEGDTATAQVYEYTGGIRPGDTATALGQPLSIPLGPGLIGNTLDGLLRPLTGAPTFLRPGDGRPGGDASRLWSFEPTAREGDEVEAGAQLGRVQETPALDHPILVPPGIQGRLEWLAEAGEYSIDTPVATVGGKQVRLANLWPVRTPRPTRDSIRADAPLVTGQRVVDLLFPVARGGTAAVPGGFGEGKTVVLQQIAKWSDADVIIYVGCGERGNEMADVLDEMARLQDPRSGRPLLDRTVVIANTSNMPVMAREASVYTGVTVAEYFRDLGYDALVIADSTSRWAEALREFASRAGELPAEEGFPAGLSSALAAFYERAGRAETLGGGDASVTIIASVSPPGGDFTEPVTSHTRRFVRSLWALDRGLAAARHYPAVSWRTSFAQDAELLAPAFEQAGAERWLALRARATRLLADEDRLAAMVELVGVESMPQRERVILLASRLLRVGVLRQSALSEVDAYSPIGKGVALLEMVLEIYDRALAAIERGVNVAEIEALDWSEIVRACERHGADDTAGIAATREAAVRRIEQLS